MLHSEEPGSGEIVDEAPLALSGSAFAWAALGMSRAWFFSYVLTMPRVVRDDVGLVRQRLSGL